MVSHGNKVVRNGFRPSTVGSSSRSRGSLFFLIFPFCAPPFCPMYGEFPLVLIVKGRHMCQAERDRQPPSPLPCAVTEWSLPWPGGPSLPTTPGEGEKHQDQSDAFLGIPSAFFPGDHQQPRGNSRFLKRTMVEKNGESTRRALNV